MGSGRAAESKSTERLEARLLAGLLCCRQRGFKLRHLALQACDLAKRGFRLSLCLGKLRFKRLAGFLELCDLTGCGFGRGLRFRQLRLQPGNAALKGLQRALNLHVGGQASHKKAHDRADYCLHSMLSSCLDVWTSECWHRSVDASPCLTSTAADHKLQRTLHSFSQTLKQRVGTRRRHELGLVS